MADFLNQMKARSLERAQRLQRPKIQAALARRLASRDAPKCLPERPIGILAEIKPNSPAEGSLCNGAPHLATLQQRAQAYVRGGAVALSVLTEPSAFGGDIQLLEAVAGSVSCPVLRKDFLVHPIQIDEAAAYGASGVLLIARLLSPTKLQALLRRADALNLFVLLEIFEAHDLEPIRDLLREHPTVLIGVNSRDLTTLTVRPDALQKMAKTLPLRHTTVAESGLHTPGDISRARDLGYSLHLVGSALMRASRPDELVRALTAAALGKVAA